MLKQISNGFKVMSEKTDELAVKAKRAELIRAVKKIDDLEKEIKVLREREAGLMAELGVNSIVWNDEGIELA